MKFIYGLVTPHYGCFDYSKVFYVGQTVNKKNRISSHMNGYSGAHDFIQTLLERGEMFAVAIFEVTEDSTANERESYWIHKSHEHGAVLFNYLDPQTVNPLPWKEIEIQMEKQRQFNEATKHLDQLDKKVGIEMFKGGFKLEVIAKTFEISGKVCIRWLFPHGYGVTSA